MKTGIILSKNESRNIAGAVKNLLECVDEVLVVDSGSSDDTVAQAISAGARVYEHAFEDYAAQRNYALSLTDARWVIYLDADERLSVDAINFVKEQVDESNNYEFERRSYAFGREFRYGALRPDRVARMFVSGSVQWVGAVHERACSSKPVKRARGYIEHYTYKNWSDQERKSQKYTELWARSAYEIGRRTSHIGVLVHAFGGFLKMYVVSGGLLDGWYGLYTSLSHFHYELMKYLKLLELQEQRG